MKINDGQLVLIKNPHGLVGTALGQRPGDLDLPEEERHYIVRIGKQMMTCHPKDIEPIETPPHTLKRHSSEWNDEMRRLIDAGQRVLRDNDDTKSWSELIDAASKLGIVVDDL